MSRTILICLLISFTPYIIFAGDGWIPRAYLKLPVIAPYAAFGNSVSLSSDGSQLVVGAVNFTDGNGGLAIYSRNVIRYNWTLDTFIPSTEKIRLGNHVSINSRNQAAAAAPNGSIAYLYQGDNHKWNLVQNFTNPDGALNWGRRVSMNANGTLVVGGDQAVWVYDCQAIPCVQIANLVKPAAFDQNTNISFGSRVILFGNTIAVGSFEVNNFTGAVYLFNLDSGTYNVTSFQTLISPSPGEGSSFGRAMAVHKDMIAVGSPYEEETGAVHIFQKLASGRYRYIASLAPPVGWTISQFGYSVALAEDTIVVGAIGTSPGYVLIYHFDKLFEPQILGPLNTEFGDSSFGSSVLISNGMLVVGCAGDNANGTGIYDIPMDASSVPGVTYGFGQNVGSGSVYLYTQDCNLVASDSRYPLATCPDDTEVVIREDFIIEDGVTFTLPQIELITVKGDFVMKGIGSTLTVTAGTVLNIEGCVKLAGTILLTTDQTNYNPKVDDVRVELMKYNCYDGSLFDNVTVIASATDDWCKFVYAVEDSGPDFTAIVVKLDTSNCANEVVQSTSLVLAILLLIFGLPSVVLLAFLSQFYLGRYF